MARRPASFRCSWRWRSHPPSWRPAPSSSSGRSRRGLLQPRTESSFMSSRRPRPASRYPMFTTIRACGATVSASSRSAPSKPASPSPTSTATAGSDIFVVSKNGPCALYRQTAPFKFVNIAAAAGVDCADSTAPEGRRHRGGHQPGRLARHLRLPLRRPEPALRQQRRRHLHRTRPRIRPRHQGRLRHGDLRRLRRRRLPRLLPGHQHSRFFEEPARPPRLPVPQQRQRHVHRRVRRRPASGA